MSGKVVHVLSGQPFDVYVGRANRRHGLPHSALANPYKIGKHGDREKVLWLYGQMIEARVTTDTAWREQVAALRGKTLACWCAAKDEPLTLDDPVICHAQILLKLAEELAGGG